MDAIELLLSKNAEHRTAQVETLISGRAVDYAEYKHICGVIRGLDLADAELRDLAKRMEKSDE